MGCPCKGIGKYSNFDEVGILVQLDNILEPGEVLFLVSIAVVSPNLWGSSTARTSNGKGTTQSNGGGGTSRVSLRRCISSWSLLISSITSFWFGGGFGGGKSPCLWANTCSTVVVISWVSCTISTWGGGLFYWLSWFSFWLILASFLLFLFILTLPRPPHIPPPLTILSLLFFNFSLMAIIHVTKNLMYLGFGMLRQTTTLLWCLEVVLSHWSCVGQAELHYGSTQTNINYITWHQKYFRRRPGIKLNLGIWIVLVITMSEYPKSWAIPGIYQLRCWHMSFYDTCQQFIGMSWHVSIYEWI